MTPPPLDETLEIFGQQSSTAFATPFVFCYSFTDPSDLPRIVAKLEHGLVTLAAAFPWVAGKVVNEGKTDTSSGVFKIKPLGQAPRLIVRDLRGESGAPTMQALERADFPVAMLDEALFSPINVLPGKPDEDRSPLLVLQANQIDGGLLLNMVGNHQALDGTGQEQLAYLLNKACHGIPYTEDEVAVGNLPRATVVTPFDESWQLAADSQYLKKKAASEPSLSGDAAPTAHPSQPRWVNIAFSGAALAALKAEASKHLATGFISTDDALTALIWQALSRARLARLPHSVTSTIGRAVNPRRYLNIPPNYPGYISNMAYSTQPLGSITQRTLSSVASELRAAVDPETSGLGRSTREFATLLHRADDKDSVSANEGLDLGRDLMLSSWANMRCYAFDFGLGLGLPVAFRRTRMASVPSLMFLLPKRTDGEIVLTLCAQDDDLQNLQEDPVFTKYGRFIG